MENAKPKLPEERFVPMNELVARLGITRAVIYKTPGLKLVRIGGKAGALNSELRRFLASLPPVKRRA